MLRGADLFAGVLPVLVTIFSVAVWSNSSHAAPVDFSAQIKPLLEARCVGCHGPGKASGGFRMDERARMLAAGDDGPQVVPGNSGASPLVANVARTSDTEMPPAGKGTPLSAAEVALIRSWIDAGAPWPDGVLLTPPPGTPAAVTGAAKPAQASTGAAKPEQASTGGGAKVAHWAFRPPSLPAVPEAPRPSGAWVRNPIDAFVLAKLGSHGLRPSPEADRATLARRLWLDLVGLPPPPAAVDAFVRDRRPDAYERLVDDLLASPHYGERWGRLWLDAARYADTNGFEKDALRSIWPYRDWVLAAFNDDVPFERFVTEQLAGDLLPGGGQRQHIATGFLRNSMLNEEGGVEPEQFRVEGVIDRVDAVGKAFLGLTVACAQCHNHKFDPIPQREYYEFFAFLNDDEEDMLEIVSPEIAGKRAEISEAVAAMDREAIAAEASVGPRMAAWEGEQRRRDAITWQPIAETIHSTVGIKFERKDDDSFIARGDRGSTTTTVTGRPKLPGLTGVRVELLTDSSLPYGGPGRTDRGLAYLSDFAVLVGKRGAPADAARPVAVRRATASFAASSGPIESTLDGDTRTAWSIDAGPGRRNADREAVYELAAPLTLAPDEVLLVKLDQRLGDAKGLGRFRVSVTSEPAPAAVEMPRETRRLLHVPVRLRSVDDVRALFAAYRSNQPKLQQLNERIDAAYKDWPYGPTTLVVTRRARPRQTHVFRRGDWRSPGPAVSAKVPASLHPFPPSAPPNRLGLAQWIVDPQNPLTPRVIVNRIWQAYFGEGLVPTPEDLGTRAEPPLHPELLDWLAIAFREGGGRQKAIHRLIVTSSTYRQTSRVTPELLAKDPQNRWLARLPRLRVDAETVHDVALAAGGLLSPKIGGPSVFPLIPDGVLSLSYGSPMVWETSAGEDRHRRALYTFGKRAVPYPSLSVFDAPNADSSCVRRTRSNTPLQALTTLNDGVFVEAAQALALRAWKEGGRDDRSRAAYAFSLATGRAPTSREAAVLLALLAQGRREVARDTAAAVLIAAADPRKPPAGLDLHHVAPWTVVARAILNLDETITRE